MNPLLCKDIRLNRTVLLISAATMSVPYLVALVFAVNESYASEMPIHRSWPNLLLAANHFCLMHWPAVAALLGGNAFACERADRSAEFLAYLPPTRWQIAYSKFTVVAIASILFWGVNLILFWLGSSYIGDDTFQYLDLSDAFPKSSFAAIGVLTFGCSWFASSFLKATGSAVVVGFAAPIVLFSSLQFTSWLLDWPRDQEFGTWFVATGLSVGLCAFVAGLKIYLGRYEV